MTRTRHCICAYFPSDVRFGVKIHGQCSDKCPTPISYIRLFWKSSHRSGESSDWNTMLVPDTVFTIYSIWWLSRWRSWEVSGKMHSLVTSAGTSGHAKRCNLSTGSELTCTYLREQLPQWWICRCWCCYINGESPRNITKSDIGRLWMECQGIGWRSGSHALTACSYLVGCTSSTFDDHHTNTTCGR